ncbi:nitroreductase family protein [Methylobacillus arboreus]|uniref:nitroreductase family protein n=1 Tax=Methylobacillus arboreus TaxID=755170 RepID=UPI001E35474E|nr:nitroreductase family protein [Methylobacillus arboreus]MCB5190198.1 nitroreductase family protein [Methylobacillus arboreus]
MHPKHPQDLENTLARRSAWPLTEPAPTAGELETILQAAAVAPDHAGLRPWHFKVVRGDNRHALLQQVLQHPDAQTERVRALHGKYALKLTTAPVVIVLAARITHHPKAPEFEQLLAAGAAVMNMLNAAHLLGYSGFWSSTPDPLDVLLHKIMAFEQQDKIIGLLNLGVPANAPKATASRPAWQTYAQVWQPET